LAGANDAEPRDWPWGYEVALAARNVGRGVAHDIALSFKWPVRGARVYGPASHLIPHQYEGMALISGSAGFCIHPGIMRPLAGLAFTADQPQEFEEIRHDFVLYAAGAAPSTTQLVVSSDMIVDRIAAD
jgi:hypothetical protein